MRTKSTGQRAHTHFLSQASAGANVDIDSRRALTCPVNANVYVTVTESGRCRASGQEFQIRKRSTSSTHPLTNWDIFLSLLRTQSDCASFSLASSHVHPYASSL